MNTLLERYASTTKNKAVLALAVLAMAGTLVGALTWVSVRWAAASTASAEEDPLCIVLYGVTLDERYALFFACHNDPVMMRIVSRETYDLAVGGNKPIWLRKHDVR